MRVLHFVSTLSRDSGVMRVIMNYYTHINREKIQFDFLYFLENEDSYKNEIDALGGKTYLVPKPSLSLKSISAIINFLKKHGNEYVWLHNHENYLTIFIFPLAKKYGISKTIVHAHLTKYSDKTISSVRNHILCFPIKYLSVNKMACSKAASNFLYGTTNNIFILNNMVEAKMFFFDGIQRDFIRNLLGISKDTFTIGNVGRFEKQKNHFFLLRLFKLFHMQFLDSKLLLVGSGSQEKELKKFVLDNQLEQAVIFAGVQEKVMPYLSAMDIFVLPSLFEGLPMVALEAQANGLYCLLSDTITKETALTNRVSFHSLNNIESWLYTLKNVKENGEYNRILPFEYKKKMDLAELANKLEQYYKSQ